MNTPIPATKKHAIRRAITFILACIVISFLYPVIFMSSKPDFDIIHSVATGLVSGILIGGLIVGGEIWYFQGKRKEVRFLPFLLSQTLYYIVVIYLSVNSVVFVHYMLFHGLGPEAVWTSWEFQSLMFGTESIKVNLYGLVMIFFVNILRLLNRMLGQNALRNLISGKYHEPTEEERVFMFLDLKSSTQIAEKLGHRKYHDFLNDFFFDITGPILESRGQIYQYVGDEVVVTWTREDGLSQADCIYCYFRITAVIARLADKYEKKYGLVPEFKAGFHYGPVVAGLVGDVKRDLVFHGDTVNTASRIRSQCTTTKRNLLLSDTLLKNINLSTSLTPERMGRIKLPGKEQEIVLFSLLEAA
jgi:adenylate cyclase